MRALITGAANRIGAKIAKHLALKGNYEVIIHYSNSFDDAKLLEKEIISKGGKAQSVKADFNNLNEVENVLFPLMKDVDILINNASIFENDDFENFNPQVFDESMQIHVKIPLLLMKKMKSQNGNVINILDAKTSLYQGHHLSYYLSKNALEYLTITAAKKLAPKIRINGIAIGYILKGQGETQELFDKMVKETLMQKKSEAFEILALIDFLLNSPSVTGQIIGLESGLVLKG